MMPRERAMAAIQQATSGERACVLAFPLARRTGFVRRQASWFIEQEARGAESNLRRQLQVQREALLRKGIDAEIADVMCRELECAIRGEVWRQVFEPEAG